MRGRRKFRRAELEPGLSLEETSDRIENPGVWTIMNALNHVLRISENSELKPELWKICREPLNYLKTTLGLTDTLGNVSKIISVDDACIVKESSTGKRSRVKKDLFKWILGRIAHYGFAEAIDIRNEFHSQASSFVTLVFKELPGFKVTYRPRRIEPAF